MAPARAGLAAAGLIDVEFTNVARMGITGVVDPQPCYVERDDCHARQGGLPRMDRCHRRNGLTPVPVAELSATRVRRSMPYVGYVRQAMAACAPIPGGRFRRRGLLRLWRYLRTLRWLSQTQPRDDSRSLFEFYDYLERAAHCFHVTLKGGDQQVTAALKSGHTVLADVEYASHLLLGKFSRLAKLLEGPFPPLISCRARPSILARRSGDKPPMIWSMFFMVLVLRCLTTDAAM